MERPAPFIVFFKDEITKFMFTQHFKNYVSDIEIHGKKVELVYGIQKDRKIRTGYDLFPVPTSDKRCNTAGKKRQSGERGNTSLADHQQVSPARVVSLTLCTMPATVSW